MSDTDSTISENEDGREDLFVSNLPATLVKRVRVEAAMRGVRITHLVEQALRSFFDRAQSEDEHAA